MSLLQTNLSEQQKILPTLRSRLREAYQGARHDALVFAALTVLLTPVAVVFFLLTLLFALALVDLPVIDHLGYRASLITGANLSLGFMAASYFLRPKEAYQQKSDDSMWLLIGGGLFCALLSLCYLTQLSASHPAWFWALYLLLALVMLGCIGHAYEPHDDYYLGWTFGPVLIDNPFTIKDDIDRAHIGLGFVVAVSHLILESYGSIFGSRWIWSRMGESEITASVTLLQRLAVQDSSGVVALLHDLERKSAADVVRALVKLDLVSMYKGRPKLSTKGKAFLEVKA
ncbi:hypothetical protein [Geomonas paludis]|uniref:Uncharacterized protein n=1 Tax=Geomonas paludis TaxID=2740185 RepID=A0A6V8MWA7_9BACT|nr:hypothetical protein [Geomonas paludis]GFO63997.1 hypothetical protein GMPD_19160 [Geomonas paludis]